MASVTHRGNERWLLDLPPAEAAILQALPDRLSALLADPSSNRKVIDRLFPTSYSDPAQQREHRRLLGASLLEARKELLADVRRLFDGAERRGQGWRVTLDPVGVDIVMRFVNDLRLALATELDVEHNIGEIAFDPEDPQAPQWALLVWLGGLVALLVESVNGRADDELGPDEDVHPDDDPPG